MASASTELRTTALGRPIANFLVPFPAVCFTLTLLTDIAYWQTANLMWQNFSAWLLLAGEVVGGLALVVGLIELAARRSVRLASPGWGYIALGAVVLVLAFFNSLVHAGDGWTAVVPWGLTLSAITVVLVLVAAIWGRIAANRRLAGVYYHG
ncbi:DUF2231 domain-containing protein [Aurantimonas sp. 22II-16-19i]|uniref:DUF2231 domain-containing protein n=1 Tax=Aurantimonas sp. 22II-16-19i TaxID=1317114 RepID=UPI0009F7D937|nr:DUF2231 domain-containing protein [Aurantimonas sp. 22II-16-19i]ORE98825.1 hypothetical protein ATO4_00625 [Aurantimonas sp. 22II-16-19i]